MKNARMVLGVMSLCVGLGMGAHAEKELVRDGGFDRVLEEWSVDPALGSWVPYQHPAGHVGMDPDNSDFDTGALISQPLNVTGIAGESVLVSIDIGSDWGLMPGNTVAVWLEYLDTAGGRQTMVALNPDNAAVPMEGSATFQQSVSFPADAERLVAITIAKLSSVWGAYVDNVSVIAPADFEEGPVPALRSVAPRTVAHGGTLTLSGSNFGATPGVLRVGGETNGVVIQTWADDAITATIGEACLGGAVQVEALGARTPQARTVAISSPYFTLMADAEYEVALQGQPVTVDLFATFANGFSSNGGITLDLPDHPGAAAFGTNPLMGEGGAVFTFDTTGLSTGVHTIVVRGTTAGSPPRQCAFDLDIREVASCQLDVAGTTLTASGPQMAMFSIMDTTGDDLSYELPWAAWSSSNPSAVDVHQEPEMWGSLYVLPHATGSATLQATLPNGAVHSFQVTAEIPAAPAIVSHTYLSAVMSNDPAETNELYCVTSGPMTYYSRYTSGFYPVDHNSWFGADNGSHTYQFSVDPETTPGTYLMRSTATVGDTSVSEGSLLQVVNNPATGLVEGRVAQFDGDYGHGASGVLKFHDPATGALLFERPLWSHSSDYAVPSVPPGDYTLSFVSDFGETGWYPNADSNTAATVTIAAGATVSGINFAFGASDAAAPDPELVGPPSFDSSTGTFGLTIQSDWDATYRFMKSTTLRDGSWYQLESFWGSGAAMTIEDTNTTSVGFYRVITD